MINDQKRMTNRLISTALIAFGAFIIAAPTAHSADDSAFQVQFRKSGWLSDYGAAKTEAKRTGKPIFVVFRCEPCGECGQFDEQVKRLDTEIADAAEKFVRVRLVRITGVDLHLFEFDYDVTWFAFFLNADEHIYGRYGGRDAVDAQAKLSLKGLRYALESAIAAHKNPPAPSVRQEKPLRAEDFAAAKRVRGNCVHCHNVNEYRRDELKRDGKWNRDLVWTYPLPENIGLTLDVDRGNLVRSVRADSAASKAGLKPGDTIKTLNDVSVASFADASYGLHRGPIAGTIPIAWVRDGKERSTKLEIQEGWRRTNLSWRPSMFDLMPRLEFSGEDLKSEEKKALGLSEKRLAFRQDKFVHSTLKAVGVRKDDVVVGIDAKEGEGTMESFLSFVRGNYLSGDKVTIQLLREGKRVDLAMTLR
jgi:serine protease Do